MELESHRRALLRLGLRMLGERQAAEDLVQDTFVRAMERPPKDLQRDAKPWLFTVATNLARDRLRKRKTRGYYGPWLPPVEFLEHGDRPDTRVLAKDEIHYALLVALETLGENERLVWTLRTGLSQSTRETAERLSLSEANVKVIFHRAKKKLADASEVCAFEQAQVLSGQLTSALLSQDHDAVLAVLRQDCVCLTDANKRYRAASQRIEGAERVATLFIGLMKKGPDYRALIPGRVGPHPAIFYRTMPRDSRDTPFGVIVFDIDANQKARGIYHAMAEKVLQPERFFEG